MYAIASVCNSTYEDKKTALTKCYDEEVELLAKNIMTASKNTKSKPADWVYDHKSN